MRPHKVTRKVIYVRLFIFITATAQKYIYIEANHRQQRLHTNNTDNNTNNNTEADNLTTVKSYTNEDFRQESI